MQFSETKYPRLTCGGVSHREWPGNIILCAPIWSAVDLRDGNQALPTPMDVIRKLKLFLALVKCGFKEIEVGFPAASNTEFTFVRTLIEEDLIPDDVTIQVLTQSRKDLIYRTVESLIGTKRAIVHLYNSTSPAQRRIVFGMGKEEVINLALSGVQFIKWAIEEFGIDPRCIRLQYSPESFSATETEFATKICLAVLNEGPIAPGQKIIINLPETVEVATPNIYADQIEAVIGGLGPARENAIISVHTHNDRGTGVAATELALLAGAERVEGTLFGNGERTGNADIVTLALNLYANGIDPKLDFSDLVALREVYEQTTGMIVPDRHPYAGDLVFTAFSGSHQDAIKKGFADWKARGGKGSWEVPYLHIDPMDIGREYREVIRVNGQSGKAGVAHLLETQFGIVLPKGLQQEFGPIANVTVDRLGREVSGAELKAMFWEEYVERDSPLALESFETESCDGNVGCRAKLIRGYSSFEIQGKGNGPLAALVHGFTGVNVRFEILHYSEHSLSAGEEASAIAYIQIKHADGCMCWGAGVDTNIELASVRAVLSALNRHSFVH